VEVLALVILVLLVALVVAVPLRRGSDVDRRDDQRRAALEAAKEAKYREIRDAELDLRMGKLGPEDHREIDRGLRAEAIEILHELDKLGAGDEVDAPATGAGSAGEGPAGGR
jgi:hypothetical protein